MPLELMRFDKNEIGLIEKSPSGKGILVATCTGPNSEINAKRLSIAFDLIEAAQEVVDMASPEGIQDTLLINNLARVLNS